MTVVVDNGVWHGKVGLRVKLGFMKENEREMIVTETDGVNTGFTITSEKLCSDFW